MVKKVPRLFGQNEKTNTEEYQPGFRNIVRVTFLVGVFLVSAAILFATRQGMYDFIPVVGIVLFLIAVQVWILKKCEVPTEENTVHIPFLRRLMGFFLEPAKTFRQSAEDPPAAALSYFVLVLVTFYLIHVIVYRIPAGAYYHTMPDLFSGFLLAVSNGMYWICAGIAVQAGVQIAGQTADIRRTARVMAYAASPLAFAGFIPVIGIFWAVWGWYLAWIGLREFRILPQRAGMVTAIIIPALATGLFWAVLSWVWPGIIHFLPVRWNTWIME